MNWSSICFHIVCILVINILCGVAVVEVEPPILEAYPPQLSDNNLTIAQWVANFQNWAIWCVISAGLASLLWYVLGQFGFKINTGKGVRKRIVWYLLSFIPIITIIMSYIYIGEAESSLWLAKLFFVLNGILPYYLTTLLFSPPSFKYAPLGAKQIRSQCPW